MAFSRVTSKSPFFKAFTDKTLLVVEYVGPTDVAALEELFALQQSIVKQFGQITMLQFASSDGAGKLDEGVRKKGAEMIKAMEKHSKGSALIIRGSSLGAMLLRTVVSGINALSRTSVPSKCFSTTTEGLSWLQSLPGQDAALKAFTPDQIEGLLGAVAKAA